MSGRLGRSAVPQEPQEGYKFALVGAEGVGKSSLGLNYCENRFEEDLDPTIEDTYQKLIPIDGTWTFLEILDTSGSSNHVLPVRPPYHDIDGFIVMYSLSSPNSLGVAKGLIQKIRGKGTRLPSGKWAYSRPVVLVGNKNDLQENKLISVQRGKDLAFEFGIPFFQVSALNGSDVGEAFRVLIQRVKEHMKIEEIVTPQVDTSCVIL